jgi:hypothetical protein
MKKAKVDPQKLDTAIEVILSGAADRVDLDGNTKVYKCAGIIRVDIKIKDEQ